MKKFIMMAVMAVAALSANAQVYVGGDVTLETTKDVGTSYTIMPEIGYNFNEKWAVGMGIGYEGTSPTGGEAYGTFKVAPYARYTFAKSGMASFFVDGGVDFAFPKGGDTVVEFGFKPGVNLAVSEKVSLVAKLGMLTYNCDSKTFAFGAKNTEISLGVFYNF